MRCNDCDHQAVHQFQVGVHSQPAHLQATVRRLYSMCRSQEKAAVDTVRRLHGTVRRLPCFSRGTLDPRCRRLWPPVGGGGPAGHAPPGRAQPPTSPPGAFSSARGGLARRRGGGAPSWRILVGPRGGWPAGGGGGGPRPGGGDPAGPAPIGFWFVGACQCPVFTPHGSGGSRGGYLLLGAGRISCAHLFPGHRDPPGPSQGPGRDSPWSGWPCPHVVW